MKKKNLFTKQLISLMLVFMLALSVAVPALAAEGSTGYSITINNNENLPDMVEGQFTAYQVFKGVLNANEPDNRQLADISWGNGVNSADLVSALKKDATLKAQFEGVRDVNDYDDPMTDYSAFVYGFKEKWLIEKYLNEGLLIKEV